MTEPTQSMPAAPEILNVYKEIGQREAFRTWRKEIPRDTRRLWIRHMIEQIVRNKAQDYDQLRSVLKESTSDSALAYIEAMEASVAALEAEENERGLHEDDERLDEARFDLDYAYGSVESTEKMLDEFARFYFLRFSTDKTTCKNFFEQRRRLAHDTATAMTSVVQNPDSLLSLAADFQVAGVSNQFLQRYMSNHRHLLRGKRAVFDSMLITGSAAIGPRSADYPKHQDLDLLFIPHIRGLSGTSVPSSERNRLEYTSLAVEHVSRLIDEFNALDPVIKREERNNIVARVGVHAPALARVLDQHPHRTRLGKVDVHMPERPEDFKAPVDDWVKFAGPHAIVPLQHRTWRKSYEAYRDRAIRSAH